MRYFPLFAAKVFNRLGLLTWFRMGYTFTIGNSLFRIPILADKQGFSYHQTLTEPFLVDFLRVITLLEADLQFIDVGVNFGQTLLKWKAVNSNGHYVGFEPSALCAYFSTRLIMANGFENVQIINTALGDSRGLITLYAHSDGDTRASIVKDQIPASNIKFQQPVLLNRLDDFENLLSRRTGLSILKVDVEGAELEVFKGAVGVIQKLQPIIIFESLPHHMDSEKMDRQKKITELFSFNGYILFLIDESMRQLNEVTDLLNEHDYGKTNYAALPRQYRFLNELLRKF